MVASCLVACASSGCAGAIDYDYSKEFDPRKYEYVIGASDGLEITVWRNGELNTRATVRPDGTITMPLIGDLKVAGRTPSQVRDEISAKLAEFVKSEAVVTVAVTGVNSYRFTVTGNVANPGTFNSQYYVSVADALAMAGGPSRFADTHAIQVIRTTKDGKMRRIPVSYADIQTRARPEANIIVVAGDVIYVP
ncbi:MAG: polysaccharide biosynthesis/export family protein [Polyangiaceae bacterium]